MAMLDRINASRYSERMKDFFKSGARNAHLILYRASLELSEPHYKRKVKMHLKMFHRIQKETK